MSRVRILGIGSPSGDDQAGWLAVDALLAQGAQRDEGVVIEKLDRPGATLVALLQDVEQAILIDAMQCGGQPGSIKRFDQQDWPSYRQGLSSHGLGVLDALLLARELGSLPPRLKLYGIEIASAHPGEQAGSVIRAAAQRLAERIAADLAAASGRHG
jgi:hydrogenase maturation protease